MGHGRGRDSGYRGRVAGENRGEESEGDRLDRNLSELLQELRVALPGVQVLFAFLLTVPFQGSFGKITPFQEKAYFVCLLLTAISAALLMAPTAYHRILFRQHEKKHLVLLANRFALAGLAMLALAMTVAILLITDLLYGAIPTAIATAGAFGLFAMLWFALPLQRRSGG
jgi:hypothetical protein